ncbi:MAG: FAD-dependent oxidoreductase [Coxiellaceae bacterium]|nr:FAD-dependent oxidoreductase [Coxiellaceae bacterium]
MEKIRVAVIGGSLSGLTSAFLLYTAALNHVQLDVSVFETDSVVPSELEQAFVADTETELLALLKSLAIEFTPRLSSAPSTEVVSLMKLMVSEVLKLNSRQLIQKPGDWSQKESSYLDTLDSMSILDFLSQREIPMENMEDMLSASILSLYADRFETLSALNALRFVSQYLRCRSFYAIKGGNNVLPNALLAALNQEGQRVFFQQAVTEIKETDKQWQLSFAAGHQAEFDYVVMARGHDCPEKCSGFQLNDRASMAVKKDGLFHVGRHICLEAPSTMGGAVKSAYKVIREQLLPLIGPEISEQAAEQGVVQLLETRQ